jgi:putative DNA primase/helicase
MIDTDSGSRQHDERDCIGALIYMQNALGLHKMPLTAVKRAAVMAGYGNARHPLKTWLAGLAWDGTSRLATFMSDAFGTKQDDYTAAVGRCWLTSMVARVVEPGCIAQYMVVLQGLQGIQKSTALNTLVGDEWFLESHYDPIKQRVDFLGSLQGKWLIEIPEMHKIGGRHDSIEEIKGMISCRFDNFRPPYGAVSNEYPRQCILGGTTNRDTWNPDPTGGRRFWPAWCGAINLDYIREQREQLFAEALALYRAGRKWHDVPIELAQAEQEGVRERDEWESVILAHIRFKQLQQVTVGELLRDCLYIEAKDWTQPAQNRVSKALRANGYMRKQVKREWVYVHSASIATAQADTDDF